MPNKKNRANLVQETSEIETQPDGTVVVEKETETSEEQVPRSYQSPMEMRASLMHSTRNFLVVGTPVVAFTPQGEVHGTIKSISVSDGLTTYNINGNGKVIPINHWKVLPEETWKSLKAPLFITKPHGGRATLYAWVNRSSHAYYLPCGKLCDFDSAAEGRKTFFVVEKVKAFLEKNKDRLIKPCESCTLGLYTDCRCRVVDILDNHKELASIEETRRALPEMLITPFVSDENLTRQLYPEGVGRPQNPRVYFMLPEEWITYAESAEELQIFLDALKAYTDKNPIPKEQVAAIVKSTLDTGKKFLKGEDLAKLLKDLAPF